MKGLFADRVLRRRFVLLVLCEFLWGIGGFVVLPSTTMPAFLGAHGAGPMVVGIMGTALGALPLLCQMFGRSLINRFRRRKRGLILLHIPIVLPYFLLAFCEAGLVDRPGLLVGLAILLLSVSQVMLGVVIPLWLDMIAQVIPLHLRGRYFGFSVGAYAAGGILGGSAVAAMATALGGAVYRGAFLVGGIFFVGAMAVFAAAPIPETAFQHAEGSPLRTRLREALRACRFRHEFGKVVWSYAGVVFAASVIPFLVVFATDVHGGLGYPREIFGRITLLEAVGGAVASVVLGWMVDHHGPRWPWIGATLLLPVIMLLIGFGRHPWVLALCALLAGFSLTHWSVSAPALLEFSPAGDKSGYVAVANLIAFVPASLGPLLFGSLIQGAGYAVAFAVAALGGVVAVVPALALPRRARLESPPGLR